MGLLQRVKEGVVRTLVCGLKSAFREGGERTEEEMEGAEGKNTACREEEDRAGRIGTESVDREKQGRGHRDVQGGRAERGEESWLNPTECDYGRAADLDLLRDAVLTARRDIPSAAEGWNPPSVVDFVEDALLEVLTHPEIVDHVASRLTFGMRGLPGAFINGPEWGFQGGDTHGKCRADKKRKVGE